MALTALLAPWVKSTLNIQLYTAQASSYLAGISSLVLQKHFFSWITMAPFNYVVFSSWGTFVFCSRTISQRETETGYVISAELLMNSVKGTGPLTTHHGIHYSFRAQLILSWPWSFLHPHMGLSRQHQPKRSRALSSAWEERLMDLWPETAHMNLPPMPMKLRQRDWMVNLELAVYSCILNMRSPQKSWAGVGGTGEMGQ